MMIVRPSPPSAWASSRHPATGTSDHRECHASSWADPPGRDPHYVLGVVLVEPRVENNHNLVDDRLTRRRHAELNSVNSWCGEHLRPAAPTDCRPRSIACSPATCATPDP